MQAIEVGAPGRIRTADPRLRRPCSDFRLVPDLIGGFLSGAVGKIFPQRLVSACLLKRPGNGFPQLLSILALAVALVPFVGVEVASAALRMQRATAAPWAEDSQASICSRNFLNRCTAFEESRLKGSTEIKPAEHHDD